MTFIANLLLAITCGAALQFFGLMLTDYTVGITIPAWLFDQFGFDFGNFLAELVTYLVPWLALSFVLTIPVTRFTGSFNKVAGLVIFITLITLDYFGAQQLDLMADSLWHSIPTILAWCCPILTCWLHRLWLK